MLKNEKTILDKLLLVTFLALFFSLLSALYISSAEAADSNPTKYRYPAPLPGTVKNFDSVELSTKYISVFTGSSR